MPRWTLFLRRSAAQFQPNRITRPPGFLDFLEGRRRAGPIWRVSAPGTHCLRPRPHHGAFKWLSTAWCPIELITFRLPAETSPAIQPPTITSNELYFHTLSPLIAPWFDNLDTGATNWSFFSADGRNWIGLWEPPTTAWSRTRFRCPIAGAATWRESPPRMWTRPSSAGHLSHQRQLRELDLLACVRLYRGR